MHLQDGNTMKAIPVNEKEFSHPADADKSEDCPGRKATRVSGSRARTNRQGSRHWKLSNRKMYSQNGTSRLGTPKRYFWYNTGAFDDQKGDWRSQCTGALDDQKVIEDPNVPEKLDDYERTVRLRTARRKWLPNNHWTFWHTDRKTSTGTITCYWLAMLIPWCFEEITINMQQQPMTNNNNYLDDKTPHSDTTATTTDDYSHRYSTTSVQL